MLLGYALFLFLAFVIGAGNDLEHSGTQFEKAMTLISLPVWGMTFIGGSAVSILKAFQLVPENNGKNSDDTESSHYQNNKANRVPGSD